MLKVTTMPITFAFDLPHSLIRINIHEDISFDDTLKTIESIRDDSAFRKGMNCLIEIQRLTNPLEYEELMFLAEATQLLELIIDHSRWAIVVDDTISFGSASIFESYIRSRKIRVRIFTKMGAARDWLGLEKV